MAQWDEYQIYDLSHFMAFGVLKDFPLSEQEQRIAWPLQVLDGVYDPAVANL